MRLNWETLYVVTAAFKAMFFATISLRLSVCGFSFRTTASISANFKRAFCLHPFSQFSEGVNSHWEHQDYSTSGASWNHYLYLWCFHFLFQYDLC